MHNMLALSMLLVVSSPAEEDWKLAPWGEELAKEIELAKRSFSGTIALHVRDPHRRVSYGYNVEKPSYLASGVKIPFMVEVFRQREKGELSFDEQLTYGSEEIRDGAPVLNQLPLGSKIKFSALMTAMMQSSDNSASDMIAKRVGLERVNAGLKELGYEGFTPVTYLIDVRRSLFREMDVHADDLSPIDIRTIRWTAIWDPQVAKLTQMLGRPRGTFTKQDMIDAFDRVYATGVNSARVDSVSRLLADIVAGKLITPNASAEMLELMSHTRTSNHRILGRLPKNTRVAHKTGSQYERICDLGIIWLPEDRPLIVCACLAGGNNRNLAEDVIARLAKKAYDVVVADHRLARAN
jgi:beta-lactamase class A